MIDKNHNKEDLQVTTGQAETTCPELMRNSTGSAGPASPLSRRKFLGRVSVSAAAMATAVGVPSTLANHRIESGNTARSEALTRASEEDDDQPRRQRAFQIRLKTAIAERDVPVPPQVDNGDERLYQKTRIGNFSKGLPHNSFGEVDANAYDALLTAVRSGEPEDFARIPLGGTIKLANPQAGLAFTLEGTDSGQLTSPPAPSVSSPERAGEMVENYWMALAREIPFSKYGSESITSNAIADFNKLSDFTGPKVNGQVTPGTLFRGTTPGELIGPYISQFLLLPVRFGALNLPQKYNTYAPGVDYLTDFSSFLACQDGKGPFTQNLVPGGYIKNGRDLGAYVKVDTVGQGNFIAALWMLANGVPFNPGNPYLTSANQAGGLNFGNQHILTLLNEVSIVALRACFYQKWFVHRHVRPEEYGGLVHNVLTGAAHYPLHGELLNSLAVKNVFSKYGTYLLPAAYPEGCPQHPSYPEAHGSVAGAGVTVLKAFFDENFVIPKPMVMVASDDGQSLLPYTGSDAGEITVRGELNKLANNVALGRDMAAVHWRSDGFQSLLLGEAVAISILRDQRRTFNEPFEGFTFTKFDGTTITV